MVLKQIENKTYYNSKLDCIDGIFIGMLDAAPMRNGHIVGSYKAYAFKAVKTEKNKQDNTISMYCQPVPWSTLASIRQSDTRSLREWFLPGWKFLGLIEFIDVSPEPDTMWVYTTYDHSKQCR